MATSCRLPAVSLSSACGGTRFIADGDFSTIRQDQVKLRVSTVYQSKQSRFYPVSGRPSCLFVYHLDLFGDACTRDSSDKYSLCLFVCYLFLTSET
jgi:hypothetical protein